MSPRTGDPPVLLVRWYDLTKWLLERAESFPKSQRFVFGQRLSDRTLGVLETLVDATWSPPGPRKAGLLARANREAEVLRWLLRLAEARALLTPRQYRFAALALEECGRMAALAERLVETKAPERPRKRIPDSKKSSPCLAAPPASCRRRSCASRAVSKRPTPSSSIGACASRFSSSRASKPPSRRCCAGSRARSTSGAATTRRSAATRRSSSTCRPARRGRCSASSAPATSARSCARPTAADASPG